MIINIIISQPLGLIAKPAGPSGGPQDPRGGFCLADDGVDRGRQLPLEPSQGGSRRGGRGGPDPGPGHPVVPRHIFRPSSFFFPKSCYTEGGTPLPTQGAAPLCSTFSPPPRRSPRGWAFLSSAPFT